MHISLRFEHHREGETPSRRVSFRFDCNGEGEIPCYVPFLFECNREGLPLLVMFPFVLNTTGRGKPLLWPPPPHDTAKLCQDDTLAPNMMLQKRGTTRGLKHKGGHENWVYKVHPPFSFTFQYFLMFSTASIHAP